MHYLLVYYNNYLLLLYYSSTQAEAPEIAIARTRAKRIGDARMDARGSATEGDRDGGGARDGDGGLLDKDGPRFECIRLGAGMELKYVYIQNTFFIEF